MKTFGIVLLLCLLGASLSIKVIDSFDNEHVALRAEFTDFMTKHNKVYQSQDEFDLRFKNFLQTKKTIARLTSEARAKGYNTQFGINKFADMSSEEFKTQYMGYKPVALADKSKVYQPTSTDLNAIPKSFDWRNKGAVSQVKNQGQCGSCWAFSTTEGVESAWFLAKGQLLDLAPQQIVDCDDVDQGCNGGDLPTAFAYVKKHGMELEKAYPYTSGDSGDSGNCQYESSNVKARISGFEYATQSNNETAMQAAMVVKGPLSICVDAETWQTYQSGIVEHDCGRELDHCVQLVGWGENSQNLPYWIVRNSWGTDWGLEGYIWVEKGKDLCGISDEATYAVI